MTSHRDLPNFYVPIVTATGDWYWGMKVRYPDAGGMVAWYCRNDGNWINMYGTPDSNLKVTVLALNNPSSQSATAASSSQINLSWSKDAQGHAVMILRNTTGTFTAPTQGTAYSVGSGTGPGGADVVYNSTAATTYNDTGRSAATKYYYKFYSENYSYYSAGVTAEACTTPSISSQPQSTTVCVGSTAGFSLTASAAGATYKWQVSTDNGNSYADVSSGGTSDSYTTAATTSGMNGYKYRCLVTDSCGTVVTSSVVTLTVNTKSSDPTSASAGSATICNGSSTTLTLTGGGGGTGETIKWYTGSCGGTLVGTGNGLGVSPSSTTTYYGRYEDGAPCNYNSACASVTVTVSPTSVGGTASATAPAVCDGAGTTITLTGYTGSIQWYKSTDGSNYTIINDATSSTLNTGNLTVKTWFRATVTSGACSSQNSTAATVDITANPSITVDPSSTTVCQGSAGSFGVTAAGVTTYKWQVNKGSSWADAVESTDGTGVASASFTTAASTTGMNGYQYRCVITGCGGASLTSGVATLTVKASSVGGTAAASSSPVCTGSAPTINLTGNTGNVTKWQRSTDQNSWTDISNTTTTLDNAPTITQTTYYRAIVQNSPCSVATSSVATVTVSATSVGGTATAASSPVCTGSAPTINLTGNTGNVTKWQYSTDQNTWTDIANTSTTLNNAPTITQTTYYRAIVQNSPCSVATSSVATVTVSATSAGGTAAAASPVCSGSTASISLSGQTGNITKWQFSTDNSTWSDIVSTANPYTSGALTQTTYFRAVVQNSPCSVAYSAAATVTVSQPATVSVQPSNASACSGSSANLTVTASGAATISYAWRKRDAGWGAGGSWSITSGGGGVFIGTSANNGGTSSGSIDTTSKAFGMYNNGGTVTEAKRDFAALSAGDVFQVDMDNGYINNGGTVGFSLQNSSGSNMIEFYFVGGASGYTINGTSVSAHSIPYTADGLRFTMTVTGSGSTFTVTIQGLNGGSTYGPYTGTFLNSGSISRFRAFDANGSNNGGEDHDLFFNNLKIGKSVSYPLYEDTAAAYSSWSGNLGHSPISGATSSSYSTTDAGSYDVVVYNSCGGATSSSASVTVNTAPSISTASLSGGTAYSAYSASVSASGGSGSGYSYSIASGSLPSGLSMNSSGDISGTPTALGTSTFTVQVTDSNGCSGSKSLSITITCGTITVNSPVSSTLPAANSGQAYSQSFGATGGSGSYTWSVTAGSLPSGLSLSSGGVLSGTSTAEGNYSFTVQASDGNSCTGTKAYTLTVAACPTITVSGSPAGGTAGSAYSASVTASGGSSPYTYSLFSGTLPTGVSLSSAGGLSGTPTAAGTYDFTVLATDNYGCTGQQAFQITVVCPTITVTPATMPNALRNAVYPNQTLSASGGTGSYTYSVSSGTLPAGLALSSGVISGTPTTAGSYTFTITATDANNCTGSREYTIVVGNGATVTVQPNSPSACSGSTANLTVTASGNATLYYAWSKNSNAGWGNAFSRSGGGGQFKGSSTVNNDGTPACTSGYFVSGQSEINDSSGSSLGMYGGAGGEAVTRTIASISTYPTVISIDMDNGGVESGKKAGFSLQTSAGTDVLQFYFLGGQANYKYNDGTERDTGIGFLRTGLRIKIILTSSTTYTLLVNPCSASTRQFNGTYSGTIARLKLMHETTYGGDANNLYFNNIIVGGYVDGALYHGSGWGTEDKGDAPIAGATSASFTTPSLTAGDNNSKYQVVTYNTYGNALSSAGTVTVTTTPGNAGSITGTASVPASSSGNTYSIDAVANASTYEWTVPSGATITGGQGTTSITVTFGASSGDITVTPKNGSCSGSAATLSVMVTAPLPDAPVVAAASAVSTNSFQANWSAPAQAVTGYKLDVSTTNDFSSYVSGYENLSVASTLKSVTGLISGQTYYYRVRAVNESGTSADSGTTTVTLPASITLEIDSVGADGQASFSGTSGAQYDVYYSDDGGSSWIKTQTVTAAAGAVTVTMNEGSSDARFFKTVIAGGNPTNSNSEVAGIVKPEIPAGTSMLSVPVDMADPTFDGDLGQILAEAFGDNPAIIYVLGANGQLQPSIELTGGKWYQSGGLATVELQPGQGFIVVNGGGPVAPRFSGAIPSVGASSIALNSGSGTASGGKFNLIGLSGGRTRSFASTFASSNLVGTAAGSWTANQRDEVFVRQSDGSYKYIIRAGDGTWQDRSVVPFAAPSFDLKPGEALYYYRHGSDNLSIKF